MTLIFAGLFHFRLLVFIRGRLLVTSNDILDGMGRVVRHDVSSTPVRAL